MSLDRATVEEWLDGPPVQDPSVYHYRSKVLAEAWLRQQEALGEAFALLGEAYPGEHPTNWWRMRVEELGAWPVPVFQPQEEA